MHEWILHPPVHIDSPLLLCTDRDTHSPDVERIYRRKGSKNVYAVHVLTCTLQAILKKPYNEDEARTDEQGTFRARTIVVGPSFMLAMVIVPSLPVLFSILTRRTKSSSVGSAQKFQIFTVFACKIVVGPSFMFAMVIVIVS